MLGIKLFVVCGVYVTENCGAFSLDSTLYLHTEHEHLLDSRSRSEDQLFQQLVIISGPVSDVILQVEYSAAAYQCV